MVSNQMDEMLKEVRREKAVLSAQQIVTRVIFLIFYARDAHETLGILR
jgi:hypothetical protein